MIVVDSSVWVEILADGPLRSKCEKLIQAQKQQDVLIPALVLYEVYRKVKDRGGEDDALSVIGGLSSHRIVSFDADVALLAADLSLEHKLSMTDSIALAHAKHSRADLVTLDDDFDGIAGVSVIRAK